MVGRFEAVGSLGRWARAIAGCALAGAFAGCAGTQQQPAGDGGGGGVRGDAPIYVSPVDGGQSDVARVIGSDALGETACRVTTEQAKQVPLDLYVMMDSSGSMEALTSANQTKWDAVRAAMLSFLSDPQSAGLGVGLQYFPLLRPGVPPVCETNGECTSAGGNCSILKICSDTTSLIQCATNSDCRGGHGSCVRLGGCGVSGGYCAPAGTGLSCSAVINDECLAIPGYCEGRDICEPAPYATPDVEVGVLPGAASALISSLNRHAVDGLTPTSGALSGAIAHAQALARANPTHKVAVLLATDGLPSECEPTDIKMLAAIAANAYAGTPPIAIYTIGVFAPDEEDDARMNLDALAAAGGTGRAFIINTNQNVTQSFVAALNAVRSSGLSCQYTLPAQMQDGGQLDYFSVNVQFTPGPGRGDAVTVGNVKNRASCSPTKGGWYYDADPTMGGTPQTISICDASCTQMRADPNGRVDILLGCKTVPIID